MTRGDARSTVITEHGGRPIHVELHEGLLRDTVRVWQDVRPAAGGSLGHRSCWHKGDRGIRLYYLVVDGYLAFARGEAPQPIPKPFR